MEPLTNRVESKLDETAFWGAHKLKSRIVKQISHEFRTPLTSIIGFAEILEDNIQIAEHRRIEYASYIRNEGLRLTKLINDLIGLDALEEGQVKLHFEDFEIQATIRQAVALVAESAYHKLIHISFELPLEPVIFKFDRERIVEVLYQLLHNAVRFTKPRGCIDLKVETTYKDVVISLHDNGPGIPVKDIPYLFKRFGKQYSFGEEPHCTGVGLAIVKHIVDQHDGDIAVESQVGEGSTFIVRLPILS
jgi:signal transduction histidine kinase